MATSAPTTGSRVGWYSDPSDPEVIRYWDGRGWTGYTLPRPEGWGDGSAGSPLPWWQTWWAVVPGLMLCLPFGLVGLWRRPAASLWLRVGLTLTSVAFFAGVILTDDESTPPQTDESASSAGSTAPTPTPDASPTESEPPRSTMPEVTGLSRKQAERELSAAGLVVRKVRQVPSALPAGTVLRQGKKVGASLLAGSAVTLVVAAPYPRVPDVVGRFESGAVRLLRSAGFKVEVTTETRTSGKDGLVLRQTPAGSRRAKPNSSVTVVVSSVVRPVAPPPQNCTSGYRPCLPPASDYDCAGGSGDGPAYANGPIYVSGSDPYDLDRDGDGVACET